MKKKSRSKSHLEFSPLKTSKQYCSQPNHLQSTQKQEKFSLYLLLQVKQTATIQQIKKQYRKLALKYHPDKNKEDPDAKQKFQKFKQAYDILADPEKRKLYDQTGIVGSAQNFDQKSFQSAYDYFRKMFKKVTKEDIQEFEKTYRFGPMQEQDLLKYYQDHKGDMVQLIESIPLSTNDDIPRFIQFFEDSIKIKIIQRHKNFDKTKNKVKLLKDQTKEFEKHQKEKKAAEFKELALKIRQNSAHNHFDFLAELQAKYGGKQKKKPQPKDAEGPLKKKRQFGKK